MRSSQMETQAAGPCGQYTWHSPATQLCDSAAMNWTVQGSVLYPSYPRQVRYGAVRAEARCPILEEIWYKNILSKKKPAFSAITPC